MTKKPITILFFADTHLGFDLPVKPRIQRRRRGHDFFANYHKILDHALANKVDMIVHGGDVFFRSKVHPTIVDQVYEPLFNVANAGIPIYLVPGNHERAQLPPNLWLSHENIHVFNKPRTYRQQVGDEVIALSGFPFVRKVKHHFRSLLHQTHYLEHNESLHFLCLHQTFEGAKVGAHNYTFRSSPDNIPGLEIPNKFTAILSGHIHRSQQLTHSLEDQPLPSPVIYSGSIERTSFAERYEEKHFVCIKIYPQSGKPIPIVEFHPIPTRPMVRLQFQTNGASLSAMIQQIQIGLSHLSPNAVVQIHIVGDQSVRIREGLSAALIRKISPSTMNITVAHPRHLADQDYVQVA